MSDAILEKNELNSTERFLAEYKTYKEKRQNSSSYAAIESYPEPPGKLSAKVERLENEIVELKNMIAAQNTVIQQLERRLAKLEAV